MTTHLSPTVCHLPCVTCHVHLPCVNYHVLFLETLPKTWSGTVSCVRHVIPIMMKCKSCSVTIYPGPNLKSLPLSKLAAGSMFVSTSWYSCMLRISRTSRCKSCDLAFMPCVATGMLLQDYQAYTCTTCKHIISNDAITANQLKHCPLCHAFVTYWCPTS